MKAATTFLVHANITLICLIILILLREVKKAKNIIFAVFFLLAALTFLIVYDKVLQPELWVLALIPIGFNSSYFFWLFSKSVFDDNLRLHYKHFIYFLIASAIMLLSFLQSSHQILFDPNTTDIGIQLFVKAVPALMSLLFVVLAILESQKGRDKDLIETRIAFRCYFIPLTAGLFVLTIAGRLSGSDFTNIPPYIDFIHKLIILAILLPFLYLRVQFKKGFFFSIPQEEESLPFETSEKLILSIQSYMTEQQTYLKEDISLKTIAQDLKIPEYKLRKAINAKLGYKNFNDFINSYRVKYACKILENNSNRDKTILEIAYSIGYKSISPFNKAFKELTGTTPTQYRKNHFA
ncbi:MAG: helix-turn-helix domain-containing protein [Flavobacteriales bacterium]|nr:helix-turn-helix domain-containing protein [Flavobacteriales bacterium]